MERASRYSVSAAPRPSPRVIDSRDISNPEIRRHQDDTKGSKGFFRDILSDDKGPSVHRYQSLVFNVAFAFAFWFVLQTVESSSGGVFPEFAPTTLALLTFSSGTYLAIKATENQAAPGAEESTVATDREGRGTPTVSQTLPKAPSKEEAAERSRRASSAYSTAPSSKAPTSGAPSRAPRR
jgi:hypothetical protein